VAEIRCEDPCTDLYRPHRTDPATMDRPRRDGSNEEARSGSREASETFADLTVHDLSLVSEEEEESDVDTGEDSSGSREASSPFARLTMQELDLLTEGSDTESDGGGTSMQGNVGSEDGKSQGLQVGQDGSGPTYNGRPIFKPGAFSLPPGLVSVVIALAT